jgi:hypothetical protein
MKRRYRTKRRKMKKSKRVKTRKYSKRRRVSKRRTRRRRKKGGMEGRAYSPLFSGDSDGSEYGTPPASPPRAAARTERRSAELEGLTDAEVSRRREAWQRGVCTTFHPPLFPSPPSSPFRHSSSF